MQKKKIIKKIIFTIIGLLVIIGIYNIIIYLKIIVIDTNYIQIGKVDIEIQEYTINNNGDKIKWEDKKNIVPGEKINKIYEISCVKGSTDCYIRAKVDIKSKNKLPCNILNIDTNKWYYCEYDGFWYYKEALTADNKGAILYTQLNLPESFNNEYALEEFEISIKAEAIQSKKNTSNFNNDITKPWLGITENEIEEFTYTEYI